MTVAFSETFQLVLGVVIGFGVNLTMEKNGISLFEKETRSKAASVLLIFCTAWVVAMTAITAFLGK